MASEGRIKEIIGRDKRIMITTTRQQYPLVVSHGEGDYIYDVEGNRFLDFSSFIAVYNFGVNARKEIRSAAKKQIDSMMHAAFYDYYAESPVRFAEKLVSMFPKGFGKVFFSNSGTEANEAALKFSKIFTKKPYVISFHNAFHGRTMGSLSLTYSLSVQREHFGPFTSALHAPYAYCYRCPLKKSEDDACCLDGIDHIRKNILSKEVGPGEVASIFIEPIQGEGGYIVPPVEFVKELRKLASENGILLVSDEVQAGYMRTGSFLALDNFGVEADIYTMAKAIGGGLPMGATVTRTSLGDMPKGAHANTFGGNLVSIAAAEASLDYVKRNYASLRKMSLSKGRIIMARLLEMKERYEIIGDVRGIGMMIGIELVKDRKSKEYASKERDAVLYECFNKGLILLPAGPSSIRIIPPITISIANIKKGLDILEGAIKALPKKSR